MPIKTKSRRKVTVCYREIEDADGTRVCNNQVPPGEQPFVALDGRKGTFLSLCAECREEYYATMAYWNRSATHNGLLHGSLLRLPGEVLVSHADIRQAAIDGGRKVAGTGALRAADVLAALPRILVPLVGAPGARAIVQLLTQQWKADGSLK